MLPDNEISEETVRLVEYLLLAHVYLISVNKSVDKLNIKLLCVICNICANRRRRPSLSWFGNETTLAVSIDQS